MPFDPSKESMVPLAPASAWPIVGLPSFDWRIARVLGKAEPPPMLKESATDVDVLISESSKAGPRGASVTLSIVA